MIDVAEKKLTCAGEENIAHSQIQPESLQPENFDT